MGSLSTFELIATARSRDLVLTEAEGKLLIAGPRSAGEALLEELRARRVDIIGALTHPPGVCAHCGSTDVAIISWVDEPFCRPCAQQVGTKLLQEEAPWILERPAPTLDIDPPPAPPGCVADLEGNIWALRCQCGRHVPPGEKGHGAQPVNYRVETINA